MLRPAVQLLPLLVALSLRWQSTSSKDTPTTKYVLVFMVVFLIAWVGLQKHATDPHYPVPHGNAGPALQPTTSSCAPESGCPNPERYLHVSFCQLKHPGACRRSQAYQRSVVSSSWAGANVRPPPRPAAGARAGQQLGRGDPRAFRRPSCYHSFHVLLHLSMQVWRGAARVCLWEVEESSSCRSWLQHD